MGQWASYHEQRLFFTESISKLGSSLFFLNIILGREDRVKELYLKFFFSLKTIKEEGFLVLGSNGYDLLPAMAFQLVSLIAGALPSTSSSSSGGAIPEPAGGGLSLGRKTALHRKQRTNWYGDQLPGHLRRSLSDNAEARSSWVAVIRDMIIQAMERSTSAVNRCTQKSPRTLPTASPGESGLG